MNKQVVENLQKTTKKEYLLVKTGNKIEIELKEIYYSRETDVESFRLKIWLKETPIFYFMTNREFYNAGYLFDGDAYGYDKDCGRKWSNKKIDIITDPYFSEDESVDEDEIECEKYCLECAKRSEAVRDEKYDRQYYNKQFLAKYIEEKEEWTF